MKTLANFSLLVCFVLLTACGGSGQKQKEDKNAPDSEIQSLKKEVHKIHNGVMDKQTKYFMGLKDKVGKTLKKLDTSDAKKLEAVKQLKSELDTAHKSMRQWMRNYNPGMAREPGHSKEEKLKYFKEQKEEIQDIKQQTNKVLEKADKLLTNEGKESSQSE